MREEDLHILGANISVKVIENFSTFTTGICIITGHREQRWFWSLTTVTTAHLHPVDYTTELLINTLDIVSKVTRLNMSAIYCTITLSSKKH